MGEKERELLKLVCLPQKELADAMGVSYMTLRNWSSGRTEIPPEYRTKLAAYVKKHAKHLAKEADRI